MYRVGDVNLRSLILYKIDTAITRLCRNTFTKVNEGEPDELL